MKRGICNPNVKTYKGIVIYTQWKKEKKIKMLGSRRVGKNPGN